MREVVGKRGRKRKRSYGEEDGAGGAETRRTDGVDGSQLITSKKRWLVIQNKKVKNQMNDKTINLFLSLPYRYSLDGCLRDDQSDTLLSMCDL
jgi:hypothetical protein